MKHRVGLEVSLKETLICVGMAMRKAGCEAALAMTAHSGETLERRRNSVRG